MKHKLNLPLARLCATGLLQIEDLASSSRAPLLSSFSFEGLLWRSPYFRNLLNLRSCLTLSDLPPELKCQSLLQLLGDGFSSGFPISSTGKAAYILVELLFPLTVDVWISSLTDEAGTSLPLASLSLITLSFFIRTEELKISSVCNLEGESRPWTMNSPLLLLSDVPIKSETLSAKNITHVRNQTCRK